jgi:hypothetical protein
MSNYKEKRLLLNDYIRLLIDSYVLQDKRKIHKLVQDCVLGCAKPAKPLVPIKPLSRAKPAYPSDLYLKRFLHAEDLFFSLQLQSLDALRVAAITPVCGSFPCVSAITSS